MDFETIDEGEGYEHYRARLVKFLMSSPEFDGDERDLNNALYSASEAGLFEDLSIQPELAILIWRAVENVRRNGFPDELRI